MAIGSESQTSTLENLSALADGEVDSAAVAQACSAWRDDVSVRLAWHSYQLIGDVLRSGDLAIRPDAKLALALHERLAAEPTVLAPQAAMPRPETGGRYHRAGRSIRWTWVAPSAVAAGFVLVAGALMATRQQATPGDAGAVLATSRFDRGGALESGLDNGLQARATSADIRLLRDARLDRYLAAHQQFAGTTALGVPSGFLRNAAAEAPNR